MTIKKLLLIAAMLINSLAWAQENEFCTALHTIMKDAPNQFKNIRGKTMKAGGQSSIWTCGITIPGTISSHFVSYMGLFYEGAVYASKDKSGVANAYMEYKNKLGECLLSQGYEPSYTPNFYPGMGDYKKVAFLKSKRDNIAGKDAPAHVALEALYNKTVGLYTVVFYIYEH